jgi:uncharacterized protein YbbC (DUF1343 family)
MTRLLFFVMLSFVIHSCNAQQLVHSKGLVMGASQTEAYYPLLKGKTIAVVANPTSVVNGVHLVDTLVRLGIKIKAVFAPEHGFRGEAGAGDTIKSGVDSRTGLKVISLYGQHKKPTKTDLEGVNMVVFDIQDVGVRFYTYISTLQYVMEACAENNIPLLIFDRPNPHGFYIDGPVLDTAYKSFVGMCSVPVVHGLTVAEYALMLNGEKWLAGKRQCELFYIKMKGWDHNTYYELPIRPSPNLPNTAAIMLYPSLCFFEGTPVSVGRGTDYPFQAIGYPGNMIGSFMFTPRNIPGVAVKPPHENQQCTGFNLYDFGNEVARYSGKLHLNWLLQMYQTYPDTAKFFTPFFDKLAGTNELREQIRMGWSEEQIRNSWGSKLEAYRITRKKYLLYRDFE